MSTDEKVTPPPPPQQQHQDQASNAESTDVPTVQQTTLQWFFDELTGNPINIVLLLAILYLLYKILKPESEEKVEAEPPIPPMKKQDFTPRQLKEYDGTGEHGRTLIAVLGKVFDVTKSRNFYGPGGPYASFAGRDASRGLATFNVNSACEEYDDLSDLKQSELNQVREWEEQFTEKYPIVGKLLKPDEQATVYTDDEEDVDEKEVERENKSLVGGNSSAKKQQ